MGFALPCRRMRGSASRRRGGRTRQIAGRPCRGEAARATSERTSAELAVIQQEEEAEKTKIGDPEREVEDEEERGRMKRNFESGGDATGGGAPHRASIFKSGGDGGDEETAAGGHEEAEAATGGHEEVATGGKDDATHAAGAR